MIRQAISCDVCGTEKRQTNHWFVAFELAGELRLGGWISRNRARPNSKHLCGQTCLHKLVDEYIAQIVAYKPQPALDDSQEDDIEYQDQPVAAQPLAAAARPARAIPAPRPAVARPAARDRDHDSKATRVSEDRLIATSDSRRNTSTVNDRSLTNEYDYELDLESSARLIPTPEPEPVVARPRPSAETQPAPLVIPQRPALVAAPKPTDHTIIELPLADEAPSFSSRKWRNEAWERERARELRAANNTPSSIVSRLRLS